MEVFCSYVHFENITLTFMHLADTFIQSDLQCIQVIHFLCQYVCSLGIKPTTFALLTQCSTAEPQEHFIVLQVRNIVRDRSYSECIMFLHNTNKAVLDLLLLDEIVE